MTLERALIPALGLASALALIAACFLGSTHIPADRLIAALLGQGTFVGNLIAEAGLTNFETRPGWHGLPLERLTGEQPDLVAASFFDSTNLSHDIWSAARHPIARAQIDTKPAIELPGTWTACGAWFALDAVEALAGAKP